MEYSRLHEVGNYTGQDHTSFIFPHAASSQNPQTSRVYGAQERNLLISRTL